MRSNFETWLREKHAEQFIGTKDVMVDDFEKWIQELEIDDWLGYGDGYALYTQKLQLDRLEKKYVQNSPSPLHQILAQETQRSPSQEGGVGELVEI